MSWATEFKTTPGMSGLGKFVEQLKKDGISFQGLPIQQQQQQQQQSSSQVRIRLKEGVEVTTCHEKKKKKKKKKKVDHL